MNEIGALIKLIVRNKVEINIPLHNTRSIVKFFVEHFGIFTDQVNPFFHL